jgi:hypothetical protein
MPTLQEGGIAGLQDVIEQSIDSIQPFCNPAVLQ